ncbi:MAG: GntR family transcriptional regulator [bacterium]|nr:GntR family transcriptional regulator [bacterium]
MKTNTSVQKVAQCLRHDITYGNFKPFKHLKEAEVAKKYNVSRVPVREAFRMLHYEGYLDVIHNKGCFVKKISNDYIIQTATVYKLLVPVILEKAIPKYTKKTFERADKVLNKIEQCKNFSEVGYLIWEFAKIIYTPSGMPFTVSIFDDIYRQSVRVLNEFFETRENALFKVKAHKEFIELCKEKKTREAIIHWTEFVGQMETLVINRKDFSKPIINKAS